jgi:Cyclin D1 binding domain
MSSESVGASVQTIPDVGLEHLPPDELARVLTFLRLDDVHNLLTTSKLLQSNCQDERVWYSMCDTTWSHLTDIRQWVDNEVACSPSSRTPKSLAFRRHVVAAPTTYRQLYYYLRHVEKLCGLWRVIGEGPVGAFISFKWSSNGLEGEEISYSSLKRKPDRQPYFRICPRKGLNIEIEWDTNDDDEKSTATLKIYPHAGEKPLLHRSSSAEAAAAVSFGGGTPQSSATVLGTSPEGSFEYAWLEFMSTNVAKPSKMRRRSSRGMGAASNAPVLHHLRKIDVPKPSLRHPLAGLYVGDYGHAGFQVIRVAYDFTGRAARLVADKIIGDEGVSAGQRTWWTLAAPVETPWPEGEIAIMGDLQRLQEESAEEHALEGLEALFLEEEDEDEQNSESSTSSRTGSTAGGRNENGSAEFRGNNQLNSSSNNKQVVGIHIGAGQVGVGNGQPREWVEGRLWILGDGTLKMWWMEHIRQGVTLKRIDADVVLDSYGGIGGRDGKSIQNIRRRR